MTLKIVLAAVLLGLTAFSSGNQPLAAPKGAAAARACSPSTGDDVWLVKTGGAWRQGTRYGYYRVVVQRKGIEHAADAVEVQISEANDQTGTKPIKTCVPLDTPGLKGHVSDVWFTKISDSRMAIGFDIEMKAMKGIVLREVFVVSSDGETKRVNEAKSVELD